MAHLDLHEQEQVDKLKYFWKDWGKYIIGGVAILIVGYVANTSYSHYQQSKATDAVVVYNNLTADIQQTNDIKIYADTDKLVQDFSATEYAPMGALITAKYAFDKKDYAKAEKYLTWTIDNSKDKSLSSLAVLRLSSVYVDQQKFDKAREILKTKHDIAFDGLFYEARGDTYVAMGDLSKARDAYKEGLQKAANDPTTQQSIQMKLSIIGG